MARCSYFITDHPADRYRERVAPHLSLSAARRALRYFVNNGVVEKQPREWMRHITRKPGARYIYSNSQPELVAIVVRRTVKTVFARTQFVDGRCAIQGHVGANVRWIRFDSPEAA